MKTYLMWIAVFGIYGTLGAQSPSRSVPKTSKPGSQSTTLRELNWGRPGSVDTLKPKALSVTGFAALPFMESINGEETRKPLTEMDKEIEVVASVLSKLIQQEFNHGDTAVNVKEVKGSYLPGSGVLFTINQHMPFYRNPMVLGVNGRAIFPSRYRITTLPGRQGNVINLGNPNSAKAQAKTLERGNNQQLLSPETPNLMEITGDSIAIVQKDGLTHFSTNGSVSFNQNTPQKSAKIQDSLFASKLPRMKKVMEKFLAEYTILLGKLKPEEKIWVTWNLREDYWGFNQGSASCELSSRIVKQDMLDLRAGKLDKAKFTERIQYSVTHCAEQAYNPDLDIFTAILERLFTSDKSFDLYQIGAVNADAIGGFGYVFKLKFSPKFIATLLNVPSGGHADKNAKANNNQLTKEEIDQQIKNFKTNFPKPLLEYSRILRGLQSDEILKVEVSISDNNIFGGITRHLSFVVPQAVIRNFDAEKMSLEEAVKLVQVEEK